ncbi:MAG: hypothetical protein A2V79_11650 [Betaproteobacteria bacterium RBG_16_56_24]|nr:MAG: hypothetical protein A2V79_11650 [Betaproteobacteria bacterium RBG_16_56_24]
MSALDTIKAAAARASLKSRPAQREATAAKAEAAEQAKTRFEDDFELVAAHFRLRENGEFDQALDAAKMDKAGAVRCYAAIAASLRRDNTAAGLTDRIKARIANEARAAA